MTIIYIDKLFYYMLQKIKSFQAGGFMERFKKFIEMSIEFIIMTVIYLVILPFRLLYNLSNRIQSR